MCDRVCVLGCQLPRASSINFRLFGIWSTISPYHFDRLPISRECICWQMNNKRFCLLRIPSFYCFACGACFFYCVILDRSHNSSSHLWKTFRILTANFILFVANKLLYGPWNVCSVVDESASHTHSDPSRSADMMRRESINTVTQLIAALCPYQKLIGVKFYECTYFHCQFARTLCPKWPVPHLPWMWWQSNRTPNSTRQQFYLRHPTQ